MNINDEKTLNGENDIPDTRKDYSDENEEDTEDTPEIKPSLSDLEMSSNSDVEEEMESLFLDDSKIKVEIESDEAVVSSGVPSDNDNLSISWHASSDEEVVKKKKKKAVVKPQRKRAVRKSVRAVVEPPKAAKKKRTKSPKPKRPRGRPKQPRRNVSEGGTEEGSSSEEEDGTSVKPELQRGIGYPVEFKMKVLKYSDTHSTTATAEKFGLQPVRVRDWKRSRTRIEDESNGVRKRRARPDGFTVKEKLQAVTFAMERSIDEARLLYNVDRNTIGKWKAKKEELEARLLKGEGNRMTQMGPGRRPRFTHIEESLRDWIVALRLKEVTVNYKMILNKAKALTEQDSQDLPAPRTWTWVTAFLKRHNLLGLLGNTFGHEDPKELVSVQLGSSDVLSKSLVDKIVEIPENPNKRSKKSISLEVKVNIIRRIEQGEPQGTVAKSLKMATSTIQTIWSCRNEILRKYLNPKSKTRNDALVWKEYKPVGAALKDWMERNESTPMDSNILMKKAGQLAETYKLPNFSIEAKQYLKCFCKKHKFLDLLTELRNNNCSVSISSTAAIAQCPTNYATVGHSNGNNLDPGDHQSDDDFANEFNISEFLSIRPTDTGMNSSVLPTHALSSQSSKSNSSMISRPPMSGIHASVTENWNSYKLPTTVNTPGNIPLVNSTTEAVKAYSLLRNWIQTNYGPQEDILSSHLSVIENTVLKKRMSDIEFTGNT